MKCEEKGGRSLFNFPAIVEFDREGPRGHCARRPFQRGPDFGVTSVNHGFADLPARVEAPR